MAPQPYRKRAKGKRHGTRNEKQRENERKRERKREKKRVLAAGRWKEAQRKKIYKGEVFGGQGGLDRPPAFPDPFDTE
jgi:hypothetical protein